MKIVECLFYLICRFVKKNKGKKKKSLFLPLALPPFLNADYLRIVSFLVLIKLPAFIWHK